MTEAIIDSPADTISPTHEHAFRSTEKRILALLGRRRGEGIFIVHGDYALYLSRTGQYYYEDGSGFTPIGSALPDILDIHSIVREDNGINPDPRFDPVMSLLEDMRIALRSMQPRPGHYKAVA